MTPFTEIAPLKNVRHRPDISTVGFISGQVAYESSIRDLVAVIVELELAMRCLLINVPKNGTGDLKEVIHRRNDDRTACIGGNASDVSLVAWSGSRERRIASLGALRGRF
jgi:hypothetical protein